NGRPCPILSAAATTAATGCTPGSPVAPAVAAARRPGAYAATACRTPLRRAAGAPAPRPGPGAGAAARTRPAAPGPVETRRRRPAPGPARPGRGCRRRSRTSRSHIDRAAHVPRMLHRRARCAGKTAAWPCAHDTRHRRGRRRRFTLASPRGPEVMRLFLLSALLCSLLLAACGQSGPPPGGSVAQLERIDEVTGQGDLATPGSRVTVHYTG